MHFKNSLKRFTRHPLTRGIVGYALCALCFAGTISCLTLVSNALISASTNAMLDSTAAYVFGVEIAAFLIGAPIFTWYRNRQAQRENIKFNSTATGRKISNILKKICRRNGLTVPYIALKSDWSVNAESQSFPNPRRVWITKGYFEDYKDKICSDKHVEATLAHELAHIRQHHALLGLPSAAGKTATIFLYGGVMLSAIMSTGLLISLTTSAAFPVVGFSILGMIQLCNFGLMISKAIGNIGSHILDRALETDADLTACKLSSVQIMLKRWEQPINVQKAPKTYGEWATQSVKSMTNYYDSWYRTHPTNRERTEDIKTFYPAFRRR